MNRYAIKALKILIFIIGFGLALWFFMPWREVGRAVMSVAESQLESRGMRLGWSDINGEEDGFTVNNLSLKGIINLSFTSVTIRPRILASILSLGGVCDINFRGGNMTMGQSMNFGDGGFLLTASGHEVLLEQLRTTGDFALNGYMAIDTSSMRISRTEASVNVPSSFESNMDMLRNFLPLVRESNGRWYLRRTAQ